MEPLGRTHWLEEIWKNKEYTSQIHNMVNYIHWKTFFSTLRNILISHVFFPYATIFFFCILHYFLFIGIKELLHLVYYH